MKSLFTVLFIAGTLIHSIASAQTIKDGIKHYITVKDTITCAKLDAQIVAKKLQLKGSKANAKAYNATFDSIKVAEAKADTTRLLALQATRDSLNTLGNRWFLKDELKKLKAQKTRVKNAGCKTIVTRKVEVPTPTATDSSTAAVQQTTDSVAQSTENTEVGSAQQGELLSEATSEVAATTSGTIGIRKTINCKDTTAEAKKLSAEFLAASTRPFGRDVDIEGVDLTKPVIVVQLNNTHSIPVRGEKLQGPETQYIITWTVSGNSVSMGSAKDPLKDLNALFYPNGTIATATVGKFTLSPSDDDDWVPVN